MPEEKAQLGHAEDFSWVRGRLRFSPLEGGFWLLEFSPDPNSPYGGRLVLGRDERLAGFEEGDAVAVEGRVSSKQASIWMAGTLYELRSIRRL